MLNYGIPTLIESPDMEDCARLCQELGLQFVELNLNLPQYEADAIDIARVRAAAKRHNIFYTMHMDENLNPWEFNTDVRAAYVQTALNNIEMAKALDVSILNMHMVYGIYFTLPDQKVFLYDAFSDQYLDAVRRFRDQCHAAIGDSGVKICIENCAGYMPFQCRALDVLLESLAFGLTLDVGHNHGAGYMDEDFITNRRHRLLHMHIHDAIGKKDHLPLGSGEIDLKKYFQMGAENNATMLIEVKTAESLKNSMPWLSANGLR